MSPQSLPLADIHELPPVTSWPPALGWWVLALLLLASIAIVALTIWRRYKQKALLRESLEQLNQMDENQLTAKQINQLLKRHLRSLSEAHPALALSGQAWHDFLCYQLPKTKQAKLTPLISQLGESLYQAHPEPVAKADELITATRFWLKQSWPTLTKGGSNAAL